VQQEPIYNDAGQSLSSKTLPASITSARINPDSTGFASGAFVLNGVSLGALTVAAGTKLQAKDVAQWLKNADTGLTITASNEVRVPDKQLYLAAGLAINGKNIGTAPFSNKQALINAINATPNVGVFASMDTDGSLVIRNTDGSNISIENQAGGVNTNVNALGLPSGIVGGTVTMTRPLVTVATVNATQVNITADQLNLGYPLNLYGTTISKPSPGFTSVTDLAAAINTAATGVTASVTNGVLTLTKSSDVNGVIASLDSNGALTIKNQSDNTKLINGAVSLARPLATSTASNNINQVKVPANQIDLLMPLAINGQTIFKPSSGFGTSQGLVDAINKAQTVVTAKLDIDGNLILSSTNGPDNNSIQIATDSAGTNATGNALGLPAQNYRSAITNNTNIQVQDAQTDIELGFSATANHGTPADLKQLGFRTGAYIKGTTNEDLLVFVTGAGSASVAASYAGKPVDARQSLRAQPLEVSFTSATHYRIRDINTDTIVAERDFDPNAADLGVSYQGLRVSFTTPPEAGDKFNIDGNADGTGNNENILDLAAVESKALVGNKTLSASYIDHVNISAIFQDSQPLPRPP